jgi:FixJ family two-component response regulator
LKADPSALLTDPCGQGWIACISPTRLEDEAKSCSGRRVVLYNSDAASAKVQLERLQWLGCEVRTVSNSAELAAAAKDFDHHVVLVDGPSLGAEGPAVVGEINTADPTAKVVVIASSDGGMEGTYRIRRIFYYAVEPFSDNEIADILAAAFQTQPQSPAPDRRKEVAQPLNSIYITNQNRTRVRLVAMPGLLRREDGLGRLIRHKLMQRLFPIESSPDETPITPMNLLGMASQCDRLIVLLVQDVHRLPGSMVRDTKSEYVSLSGKGADKVTTLVIQPGVSDGGPVAFDPPTTESLAEHLVREMASC